MPAKTIFHSPAQWVNAHLLQEILTSTTVPCLLVDPDERLLFVNTPYLELFERSGSPSDYLGQRLSEFFYKDPEHETITGKAMRSGQAFTDLEMNVTTSGGRELVVRYDVAPIYEENGELAGAFALVVDLTKLHRQDRAISMLASFPRENPYPIFSAEESGELAYMNPAAARLLEELQMDVRRFLPGDHLQTVKGCLASGIGRVDAEHIRAGRVFSWDYHPVPEQRVVHIYAREITEQKRMEKQISHSALHDRLTGLPNSTALKDHLVRAILRSRINGSDGTVLLMLDLDQFKNVNDSLGHAVGDELLQAVADRLQSLTSPYITIARHSGDEFFILAENTDRSRGWELARAVHSALAAPFEVSDRELFITTSVGIVNCADSGADPNRLLRDADTALYRAKAKGRGLTTLFNPDMHAQATTRLKLEMDLKRGLERDEIVPYLQPIIDARTGRISGFEALARWRHPEQGIISPGVFIPLAEETGLIGAIGDAMLRSACSMCRDLDREHPGRELTMAVNLSVAQMNTPGIVDSIESILGETGVRPELMKIEITESGIMENLHTALEVLGGLRRLGVQLSIDDFGTGYSSLANLHRFPFHLLKVDQSFVSAMGEKPENLEITRTIISLARALGKLVVAEGVETAEQRDALKELGAEYLQGYLYSRPVPEEDVRELLQRM